MVIIYFNGTYVQNFEYDFILLFSSEWIVTAAHCIDGTDLEVVAGVHNVDSNEGQRVDVINTIVHENYDDEVSKIND